MELKNFNFSCPSCSHTLNADKEIELNTLRDTGERGTIYLSITFGNYTYRHIPQTLFKPNEIVEFICPNCDTSLNTDQYKKFALLNMEVGNDIKFEVIFSREAGQRKTYIITENGIESYHG